jgi:biopolymer transport protein ExbD
MSEVQTNDHDEGKKNKQKKQNLRVDFTPMVDMNMLLITFFMFCTTLLKPQTMNLNMPSNDETEDKSKARESSAVTILLGTDNEIYYYLGAVDEASYENPNEFLVNTTYAADGIRALLLSKNRGTYEKIEELKIKKDKQEITEEDFRTKSKEIQEKAMKEDKIAPTVMIKPTELATYKNMVDLLDEMAVCNIGTYSISELTDPDRYLLFKKTDNNKYLSEQQQVDANTVIEIPKTRSAPAAKKK